MSDDESKVGDDGSSDTATSNTSNEDNDDPMNGADDKAGATAMDDQLMLLQLIRWLLIWMMFLWMDQFLQQLLLLL